MSYLGKIIGYALLCCTITSVTLTSNALAQESLPPNDPKPSTGTGYIVSGWILTGVGALNLVTLPICKADFYPAESADLCVTTSLVFAGVGLGVGIPLLFVGYGKRRGYQEWRRRHRFTASLLETQIQLQQDAVLFNYRLDL